MKRIFNLTLIIATMMICFTGNAQLSGPGMANQSAEEPVIWSLSVKMTDSNNGIIIIKADVTSGWHFYGLTTPKGGPKPTSFNFDDSKGIKFTGQLTPSRKAKSEKDDMFDITVTSWDKDVTFTRPFRLEKGASNPIVNVKISYMACDNIKCSPPKTVTKTARVK